MLGFLGAAAPMAALGLSSLRTVAWFLEKGGDSIIFHFVFRFTEGGYHHLLPFKHIYQSVSNISLIFFPIISQSFKVSSPF